LATSGLAFLVIGVAALLETHVPVLILATLRGPVAAIDFGLVIRLLFVFISGLSMITAPLWPAISSARSDVDHAWVNKSLRLSGFLIVGAGVAALLVLALFGGKVIHLWTGRHLTEPLAFQVLFGIYFLQIAWSHYWGVIMIGLSRERLVSVVHLIEGLLMITLGSILARRLGAEGMIFGLVVGLAMVSNWFLPLAAIRILRRSAGEAGETYSAAESLALHAAGPEPVEPCLQ
jgi:O-antigen/teichoic acid export membrane protein